MNGQIIELLRDKKDFISGEDISRSLGITRAGIWKKVKALRQKGYLIEAVPSKGYKLLSSPDIPTKEEVEAVFKGDVLGKEIIFFDVTTSTNDRAMQIGQLSNSAGKRPGQQGRKKLEGIVIIANEQEKGRGRFGREWISPPGVNLYFTVLLEPPFSPKEASIITLMASVAVVSSIREQTGLSASIKWPNDILINNKKVGGILTEMKSDMDMIDFIAVGIGVNVNMSSGMFTKAVRSVATSLKLEKKEPVNRVELLGLILSKLEYWYKNIINGRKDTLIEKWRSLDSTIGYTVKVKTPEGVISGIAEGVSDDGELIIKLFSGEAKKVYAGEVTILKGSNQQSGIRGQETKLNN